MDKIKQCIDDYRCSGDDYYLNQVLAYSKAALKLQQPMPVMVVVCNPKIVRYIWENDRRTAASFERESVYVCQNCKELLGNDWDGEPLLIKYCPNCGQKLWWNK